MIDGWSQTRTALLLAHRANGISAAAIAIYSTISAVVTGLFAAALVDILAPLPSVGRALVVLGIAVGAVWHAWRLIRGGLLAPAALDRMARLVENHIPQADNALINAVQFAAMAPGSVNAVSESLMRREMARAEHAVSATDAAAAVDTRPATRARGRMRLVLAVAAVLVLAFPRAVRFEGPRLLLFWQDRAPFTLTDFLVSPGDARIHEGAPVAVNVRTRGQRPGSMSLITESSGSERIIPLSADESGSWSQTLEGLTADTRYYLQAETGRSERYTIHVQPKPPTASPPPARDLPPVVTIVEPGRNGVVTQSMKMTIHAMAEDSEALQGVELHRIVNNGADKVVHALNVGGTRAADLVETFDLKELGARPGDVIQYYESARDANRPAPHIAESRRYWLWVVSTEDYKTIARRQAARLGADRGKPLKSMTSASPQSGRDEPPPRPGSRPALGGKSGDTGSGVAALMPARTSSRQLAQAPSQPAIAGDGVDRVGAAARPPFPASETPTGRYPAEYRRLVQDYFRSVSGGGK